MEMHTDIKKLEAELNYEILPGTEVMADTNRVAFIKAGETVLIPQPSSSPNDPLNWTPFWKTGSVTCAVLLGFIQGFGPLSLSSQIPYYVADFDRSVNDIVNLIGVTILVLGFSNFLWIPMATQFGRRPVAILSNLVCLGSCIWRARATSYHSFLGACVVNGIGAGPAETLPPVIISDVTFLHTRGAFMGAYWWAYFGSLMVGPVVSGVMSERYGWQSFWWLNAALFGALTLLCVVWLPETKYKREEVFTNTSAPDLQKQEDDRLSNVDAIEKHVDAALGRGRPPAKAFLPVSGFEGNKALLVRDVATPWLLFTFPIVQWSSFVCSWSSSCFLVLNLTQSLVFAAPPYNFSAGAVGYTNLAILGGALIGLVTAGPSGDILSRWSTKRNRGIREPEMRLPALWPYALLLAIGTAVVSVGYEKKWDWKVIVILGYGALGWQVAAIPPLAMTYAIDSYAQVSGEFLVSMTVNKNLWGYGVSQFLIPWIEKSGFVAPLMTNAALTILFTLGGSFGLWLGGKKLRRWTKDSYIHRM